MYMGHHKTDVEKLTKVVICDSELDIFLLKQNIAL